MRKILFKTLIILSSVFMPVLSFAALNLEYLYPELPGTALTITTNSSLGEVIKYFVSWAIIIGAIIAFISLIIAGIKYIASTGKPEVMSAAKGQIFNSFLGLAILFSSYLILITINPQLIVMEVRRTPIVSGVVLLNSTSIAELDALSGSSGEVILNKLEGLINSKDAYSLKYNIKDCKEEFGKLAVTKRTDPGNPSSDAEEIDFENFEGFSIGGIGFLKNAQGKYKVILYDQENFKGKITDYAYEYNSEGRIIWLSGNIEEQTGGGAIKIINFFPADDPAGDTFTAKFHSKVEYVNVDMGTFKSYTEEQKENASKATKTVDHPPLSIQVKHITPGVYLYSGKPEEEPKEQPLTSDIEDFYNVDFNDEARKIEIKNNETTDYITILHEDAYWSGQLRIFFKEREIDWGQIAGNTTPTIREEIRDSNGDAKIDKYGKVKKPSSIQIQELSDNPSICKEVRICTQKEYHGECIVYTSPGNEINLKEENVWIATSTLPIYVPQNIPNTIQVKKSSGETKTVEFADNIRSIKIDGNCLVVLFERSVDPLKSPPDFWENESPGKHSQTFIRIGKRNESNFDLTNEQIGKCGGILGLGERWFGEPCASAIAIYPLSTQ